MSLVFNFEHILETSFSRRQDLEEGREEEEGRDAIYREEMPQDLSPGLTIHLSRTVVSPCLLSPPTKVRQQATKSRGSERGREREELKERQFYQYNSYRVSLFLPVILVV